MVSGRIRAGYYFSQNPANLGILSWHGLEGYVPKTAIHYKMHGKTNKQKQREYTYSLYNGCLDTRFKPIRRNGDGQVKEQEKRPKRFGRGGRGVEDPLTCDVFVCMSCV